jgi:nucleotide-binding universal stress UspA family protein
MSTSPGCVIVGVDGSADGHNALLFAVTEAVLRHADLRIVCAYEMPALSYTAGFDMPMDLSRILSAAAKAEVASAVSIARAAAVGAQLNIDGISVPGRPSRVLIDHSADGVLLVVGARRLGGAGRLFLGSVSTELIHHATIPVVVVPSPDHSPHEEFAQAAVAAGAATS